MAATIGHIGDGENENDEEDASLCKPADENKSTAKKQKATEYDEVDDGGTSPLADIWKASQEMRRVWFLALLASMFQIFMMLEVHFYLPYLYTRVYCCGDGRALGSRYDVTEPQQVAKVVAEASALGLEVDLEPLPGGGSAVRACSLPSFPSGSELWSLSSHCVNRAFVQDSAQGIVAFVKPIQKVCALVMLPVAGALADGIGRRPVLAAFVVLLLAASGLSALDAWVSGAWGPVPVFIAGTFMCVTFSPKDAIISSGVADVLGRDEAGKSRFFASLASLHALLFIICMLGTYHFIRMHLTNYTVPWVVFTSLAAAMLALLGVVPETLPAELRRPLSSAMFNPLQTQIRGLELLARDPVLVHLSITVFIFWAFFLGFMTTRTSYLITVGFTLEETIVPEMCAAMFGIFFSAGLVSLLPRLGPLQSLTLSFSLYVVSFTLWGPLTVLYGRPAVYAANIVHLAAGTVFFATVPTIVSQRVEKEHQGKCQTALASLGCLGAVSVPFYNHVLFRATSRGLRRAQPALASLLLALICLGLSFRIMVIARTTPPAAEAVPKDSLELEAAAKDNLALE